MSADQRPKIRRTEVPQANALPRVIELLRQIQQGGDRHHAPGFSQVRDVQYYTQAARILGLLDGDLHVTDLGLGVLALSGPAQRQRLAEAFAASNIGKAWLSWSGASALDALDQNTAEEFLAQCAELTRSIRLRRAVSLRRWLMYFQATDTKPKTPARRLTTKEPRSQNEQLTLAQVRPTTRAARLEIQWPDVKRFPHNETRPNVGDIVDADLDTSGNILLVTGYASLDRIIPFLARRAQRQGQQQVRVLFGNEPFPTRRQHFCANPPSLGDEMRDYWLERGISVLLSAHILQMRALIEQRVVDVRIRASRRPLHAKIFVAEAVATLGSSNFTDAGFGGQSEANTRFDSSEPSRLQDTRQIAEGFWLSGKDFHDEFLDLLDALLKAVTWQEALARACASILEGGEARRYYQSTNRETPEFSLWPHQWQGLSQALWILENIGSVLVADAAGSGKTRMGAGLVRAVYDRQTRAARVRYINPLIVVPPPLVAKWEEELSEASLSLRVDSHGPLSNPTAAKHKMLIKQIHSTELVVVDEAHNFLNASARTHHLLLHYADHAILFTATPINRDAADLVALIELLGADHLSDEALATFANLRRLVKGRVRRQPGPEVERLRREIERFMVRRTRTELNRIADSRQGEYRLSTGRSARYPRHYARYYPCDASSADVALADRINDLADKLTGVAQVGRSIELPAAQAMQGMTEQQYVKQIVRSSRALCMYRVRSCLRSSRAALFEHIHGTDEAVAKYELDLRPLLKEPSGNMLRTLAETRGHPPRWRLAEARKKDAPDWLWDAEAHARACDDDAKIYLQIAELSLTMSSGREDAKTDFLQRLYREQHLLLAFDSHIISLAIFRRQLREANVRVELFTGQSGASGKRKAEEQLGLGASAHNLVALCSDALSEGLNLQGASCVVHLDTPTVIRTAEQRAGRVDRMDSPHDEVQIWWPQDPPSFAPRHGERLRARHEMVSDLIGANLELPDDIEPDKPLDIKTLAQDENVDRDESSIFCDAFHPVRSLIGAGGLISEEHYAKIRSSQAEIVSCVSIVAAGEPWAFVTVGGSDRRTPRWVFFASLNAAPICDLAEISRELRARLTSGPESRSAVDDEAGAIIEQFVRRLQQTEIQLLPARRQRALGLANRVLLRYVNEAWNAGDTERHALVQSIHDLVCPKTLGDPHADPRSVADAWLRLLEPYRELSLRRRRRARKPWTLNDLEDLLHETPLPTEQLRRAFDDIPMVSPAGERIVAMIVGMPSSSTTTTGAS